MRISIFFTISLLILLVIQNSRAEIGLDEIEQIIKDIPTSCEDCDLDEHDNEGII